MSMSEREKRLLSITMIIAIIGISFTVLKYISNQVSDTSVSDATAERFEDLFAKIKNVETQKNRNQMLRKKIGNTNGQFVSEDDVLKMVAEIEQVAGQSGVKMKNWDPNVNKRTKPLAQLDIKINLECKFDQLIKFLDNLRKAKYVCQPAALSTKLKDPKKPDLEVSMTLTTYLLDAAPAPVSPTLAKR